MLGADKITVPSKHATEDEWKQSKRDLKGVPFYKDPRFNVRN